MSHPRKAPERPTPKGPDGATPVGPMEVHGIVKTTKGYAVCSVRLGADGGVLSVELSDSQAFKENVSIYAVRNQKAAALKA